MVIHGTMRTTISYYRFMRHCFTTWSDFNIFADGSLADCDLEGELDGKGLVNLCKGLQCFYRKQLQILPRDTFSIDYVQTQRRCIYHLLFFTYVLAYFILLKIVFNSDLLYYTLFL